MSVAPAKNKANIHPIASFPRVYLYGAVVLFLAAFAALVVAWRFLFNARQEPTMSPVEKWRREAEQLKREIAAEQDPKKRATQEFQDKEAALFFTEAAIYDFTHRGSHA